MSILKPRPNSRTKSVIYIIPTTHNVSVRDERHVANNGINMQLRSGSSNYTMGHLILKLSNKRQIKRRRYFKADKTVGESYILLKRTR